MRTRWRSDISENDVTPESVFLTRRRLIGAGLGGIAAGLLGGAARAEEAIARPLGAAANPAFAPADALTAEAAAGSYNNFTEFGSGKTIQAASRKLKTSPWRIRVDGACERPFELDLDDLLKKVELEERIYRHRCVETWSMVVPWTGFPLARLVEMAGPTAEAKYLRVESFMDPKVAAGQGSPAYPWPYVEGLELAEARNDLAFLAVGIYGKAMPTQHGAPLRLVLPWKYGFKSAKSLVRFSFVAKRPVSFWEELQPDEYGFFANVNPKVAHVRWSQANERRLGTNERLPTRLYNGYEAEVAGLYKGREKERIWY